MNILQNILIVPPKINENPQNIKLMPLVKSLNEEEGLCSSIDRLDDNEVIL